MRPDIIRVNFLGEEDPENRSVRAVLSDGHGVDIEPLESFGQKTYHQTGATPDRLWVTVALAEACVPWLHGEGPRPDIRPFLSRDADAFQKAVLDYEAAASTAKEAEHKALEKAVEVLTAFLKRHSRYRIMYVKHYFDDDTHDDIVVTLQDDDNDYPAWYSETLETLAATSNGGKPDICLNGKAYLSDWCNRVLAHALVDMAAQIEADIKAGVAEVSDSPFPGALHYTE